MRAGTRGPWRHGSAASPNRLHLRSPALDGHEAVGSMLISPYFPSEPALKFGASESIERDRERLTSPGVFYHRKKSQLHSTSCLHPLICMQGKEASFRKHKIE